MLLTTWPAPDAIAELHVQRRRERKTPLWPSHVELQRRKRKAKPKRAVQFLQSVFVEFDSEATAKADTAWAGSKITPEAWSVTPAAKVFE